MKKQKINKHQAVIRLGAVAVIIGIIIVIGCETTNPLTQSNNIVFPDSNILYRQYIQPVFDLNCTYSGCHDDITKSGGLSLTNWSHAFYSDPGNIIPGDTMNSKLYAVLSHRMVHIYSLDTNQNHIRGIRKWILEGAKDN